MTKFLESVLSIFMVRNRAVVTWLDLVFLEFTDLFDVDALPFVVSCKIYFAA